MKKVIIFVLAFMLVFAIVMVSVLAATGKSITMNGNVQFVVNDRSLFVKEVRMQETGGISDTITFTPGYINGDFNFNVGDIVNNRGSFTIYFDIINTTTNLHFVSVDYSGLSSIAGLEISVSPEVPASEEVITTITADTPATTTLELKVVNPNLATIDLSQIIITFVEDRKYSITLQGVDYYILGEDAEAIAINGEETIITSQGNPIIDIPIMVLVNENSASASEIFAGALKDYNKATIIGTNTYGKGVIQTLYSLSDGSGIKITTAEYCTPNRNKINEVGIEPNITVELPDDITELTDENDTQLQRAIEELK